MTTDGGAMGVRLVVDDTGYDKVGRAYAALGLPMLAGGETVTDPGIEVVIPDEVRDVLAGLDVPTADPAAPTPAVDRDRLPTDIEGAAVDDDTRLELVEEPTIPAPAVPAPAVPAAPAAPASPVEPAAPAVDPRAARRADEALRDLERIEEEVTVAQSLQRAPRPAPSVVQVPEEQMSDEEWEKFQAKVVEDASKAEDFGQAIGTAFAEMRRMDKARAKARAEKVTKATAEAENQRKVDERNLAIKTLEEAARSRHPDFDAVLDAAHMWGQVADPKDPAYNPALAKVVYAAPDLAEKAYWLGRAQLAKKTGLPVTATNLVEVALGAPAAPASPAAIPAATPAPAPAPAPAAPAVPVAPRDAAAVRREATEATVRQLNANSTRPTGLDNLTPASRPTSLVTIEQLDRLMVANPDGYRRLMEANPDLDFYHMSGGATRG